MASCLLQHLHFGPTCVKAMPITSQALPHDGSGDRRPLDTSQFSTGQSLAGSGPSEAFSMALAAVNTFRPVVCVGSAVCVSSVFVFHHSDKMRGLTGSLRTEETHTREFTHRGLAFLRSLLPDQLRNPH